MTVYLDIVVLENMLINYIILDLTGIILKRNKKFIRLLFSSFIGAFFTIASFFYRFHMIESIFLKLLISSCMIVIAFKEIKKLNFIKNLFVFYLVTFVLGGISFMVIYLNNPSSVFIKNGVLVGDYSMLKILIGIIFSIYFLKLVFYLIKNPIEKKQLICDLEIGIKGKSTQIKVLIDTGNLLRDPFTGKPVIIVEKESLKDVLEEDILENVDKILNGKVLSSEYHTLLRIIPYHSLGNENGILIGVRSDFVKIFWEQEIVIQNAIIGIYTRHLSKYNHYSGLVGLEILKGGDNKNEYFGNVKNKFKCNLS